LTTWRFSFKHVSIEFKKTRTGTSRVSDRGARRARLFMTGTPRGYRKLRPNVLMARDSYSFPCGILGTRKTIRRPKYIGVTHRRYTRPDSSQQALPGKGQRVGSHRIRHSIERVGQAVIPKGSPCLPSTRSLPNPTVFSVALPPLSRSFNRAARRTIPRLCA
jgi:hypothetical protein